MGETRRQAVSVVSIRDQESLKKKKQPEEGLCLGGMLLHGEERLIHLRNVHIWGGAAA